jgi:histidine kinase/DNA gyrase B/HSP90-like ATPase
MAVKNLTFEIAPHIVEDLGLNLYTNLPRVLVEFIANAYDADSPYAEITMDLKKIADARSVVKAEWNLERTKIKNPSKIPELESRTLPDDITITVDDNGHGMSVEDLQDKYLMLGRRRREDEKTTRSPGNRILMGRKGLGKLAGFGVAHKLTVITRKKGESHTTQIELDFEELIKKSRAAQIKIPATTPQVGLSKYGTTTILSKLVYDPLKSQQETVSNAVAGYFAQIDPSDFEIRMNGTPIQPQARTFVYAYPNPELPVTDFVDHEYETEDGRKVNFKYRIRFTGEGKHLQARDRGVRVYAHKRLAAAPDLLDLPTGIHGFRNTHYMDAVAHADFIDEQQSDYIATDRQTLRWDSPLLEPMREMLTEMMKKACFEYQMVRDEKAKNEAKEDPFTKGLIETAGLPKHRQKFAYKVAAMLAPVCEDGKTGNEYRTTLPIFVEGLGQGDVLHSLAKMAAMGSPDINDLVGRLSQLTAHEFGDFIRVVHGRLSGIEALRKLVKDVDFKGGDNEADLHDLFKKNPWLINPTFTQFLTSNQTEKTLNSRLAKDLQIDEHVPAKYNKNDHDEKKAYGRNKRPDLTFVISNQTLSRVVIVELKAPNTPLHGEHLRQLQNYIARTQKTLHQWGRENYTVEGFLIGSHAPPDNKQEEVDWLRDQIKKYQSKSEWTVLDILEVLDLTTKAHQEIVEIYEAAAADGEFDEDDGPTPKPAKKSK